MFLNNKMLKLVYDSQLLYLKLQSARLNLKSPFITRMTRGPVAHQPFLTQIGEALQDKRQKKKSAIMHNNDILGVSTCNYMLLKPYFLV